MPSLGTGYGDRWNSSALRPHLGTVLLLLLLLLLLPLCFAALPAYFRVYVIAGHNGVSSARAHVCTVPVLGLTEFSGDSPFS